MKKEEIILNEISGYETRVYGIGDVRTIMGNIEKKALTSQIRTINPEKLATFLAKFIDIKAEDLIEEISCEHITGNSGKCIKCDK